MVSVELLEFCNHAFFDSLNRPCLIGVLPSLYARKFPLHYAAMTVLVGLKTTSGNEIKFRVEIGPPDGEPARRADVTINTNHPDGVAYFPFQMAQLFFQKPQDVVARIIYDGAVIGSRTLAIRSAPDQSNSV